MLEKRETVNTILHISTHIHVETHVMRRITQKKKASDSKLAPPSAS